MDAKEEEFLKRLQELFHAEAKEHIQSLSSGLIELEKKPNQQRLTELLEIIFREAHSLKGAARSVNRKDIESICQLIESIFSEMKNQQRILTTGQYDLLHHTFDLILKLISTTNVKPTSEYGQLLVQLNSILGKEQTVQKTNQQISAENQSKIKNKELLLESNEIIKDKKSPIKQNKAVESEMQDSEINQNNPLLTIPENSINVETVRIQTTKLDPLFRQAEQMIQSKNSLEQRAFELNKLLEFTSQWKIDFIKQTSLLHTFNKARLNEIYVHTNEKINEIENCLISLVTSIEADKYELGKMIDEHVDSMKMILMIPVSTITNAYSKLVRDLSRSQHKEVDIKIIGDEIEMDKRLLEDLNDPLVHLIRNSIDHGIEGPEDRLKINKPAIGKISISFVPVESRNVKIIYSDDGAGIQLDKVKSAAIKAGLIAKDNAAQPDSDEIMSCIFKSGISTSPIITNLSGRGLGLAIVYDKVEKLGGTLSVESVKNVGTTFRILLPFSLSTISGVLVKSAEQLFYFPLGNVFRATRFKNEDIKTIEGKETVILDNELVVVHSLDSILGLNKRSNNSAIHKHQNYSQSEFKQIIIAKHGNSKIGFIVDEILEEHQVLMKDLGKQLKKVRYFSGATVLGSGQVVPVFNVSDLIKYALKNGKGQAAPVLSTVEEKPFKILVSDDSVTSRSLIKNILESSGYLVETAVDGIDAYTKALIGNFDLLVSDIDMPRMNGFELTFKIRKNEKIKELPVVLVTALESREDREHGIDVGANAYIIKSSFDQSNLIDVIEKLL